MALEANENAFMAALPGSECMLLDPHKQLYVLESGGFLSGLVVLRSQGEPTVYRTNVEAVK